MDPRKFRSPGLRPKPDKADKAEPNPERVAAFRTGLSAESRAAMLLVAKGFRIIARRWRSPVGEIDIVARRRSLLVFVEVKARNDLDDAAESVTVRQRAVPTRLQGRVGSVYMIGTFGGMLVGTPLGGLLARHWGITAPMWFGFVGSAVLVVLLWRSFGHIVHADAEAEVEDETGLTET